MEELEGVVRGLNHVAIVVEKIADAQKSYEALGLTAGELEHIADQQVNVLVMSAGPQRIELVEPASENSPVSKFLARRGAGLHHLAYDVDDLEMALAHLRVEGVRLIDEAPRSGAHGTRIAFLHPNSTGGVLTELVEDPEREQE